MACGATLKRHPEFDPLLGLPDGPSPKRMKMCYEDMTYSAQMNSNKHSQHLSNYSNDHLVSRACSNSWSFCTPPKTQLQKSRVPHFGTPHSTLPTSNVLMPLFSAKNADTLPGLLHAYKITKSKNEPGISTLMANYICNEVVAEHEQKIRDKYERIFMEKLAEQHETFLNYNYKLLRAQFGSSSASYVS